MRIAQQELLNEQQGDQPSSSYVCIDFSPWQYEDYDDVKVALMTTVLDAVASRVGEDQQDQVSRLRRFVSGLARWGRRGGRVVASTAQIAAPLAMRAIDPGIDPLVAEMVTAGVGVVATEASRHLQDPTEEPVQAETLIVDAGRFRTEFKELVKGLADVAAVVVFIDDLDRCLPETVVDTFEAIRLFLNTPKTAYVIAANQGVVESAIDSRYPQLRRPDGTGIGADYLEKMLQLKVAIPPLSAPEADTYINLLLAELRLNEEQFASVLDEAARRRSASNLQVAFNLGVAGEVLGEVPPDLIRDLGWAASIADLLGSGLRGNPRQIKRFLNNLLLKQRSADRRGITLDLPVLAKLMVLEEQHFTDFQRLFDWQLAAPGAIPELASAESAAKETSRLPTRESNTTARSGTSNPHPDADDQNQSPTANRTEIPDEVRSWADKTHVRSWLNLDPALGSIDLRPYFTYSRDKLTFGVAVTRLPPQLQELLAKVQTEIDGVRRHALGEIVQLTAGERLQLTEALVDAVSRRPDGHAFVAALELAERAPDTVSVVTDALMTIPVGAVPPAMAGNAVRRLPSTDPGVSALLDRWENSDVHSLKTMITTARKAQQKGKRT